MRSTCEKKYLRANHRGGGTGTAGTAAAGPMLNAQKKKKKHDQKRCLCQLITFNK